jgi:hypothetical protein
LVRDEIDGYITQITKRVGKVKRGRRRSETELSEGGKEQSPTKKQRGSEKGAEKCAPRRATHS